MQYRNAITGAAFGVITAICAAHAETPLERGTYLMHGIVACGNCHTPKGADFKPLIDQELAGGFVIEAPVFRAVAPNITPDKETGIGGWTDGQIVEAIRNGKRPDGTSDKFKKAIKNLARKGYIGLQDHGYNAWYKNIKLREL